MHSPLKRLEVAGRTEKPAVTVGEGVFWSPSQAEEIMKSICWESSQHQAVIMTYTNRHTVLFMACGGGLYIFADPLRGNEAGTSALACVSKSWRELVTKAFDLIFHRTPGATANPQGSAARLGFAHT